MSAEATMTYGALVGGGRFRVLGKLGKGAMGAVYRARQEATGQEVAIKVMAVGGEEADSLVQRFEQEAKVLATLRSTNTVRMIDFGRTEDGDLFMALELLVGQPLDVVLRDLGRTGTAMTEACSVAMQVLRSLAEAHGKGLVHRDLKPGNLFLVDEGLGDPVVKVLDFGIARVAESGLTSAGQMLGTPTYMSPEQWQAQGKTDHRADLYSLGCVMYCCVTGQPPYLANGPVFQLMSAHLQAPIPDPRALAKHPLSDGFVHIVRTAMAKDPGQRFADAKAMREALQALVGGAWAGTPVSLAHRAADAVQTPTLDTATRVEARPDAAGEQEDRTIAKPREAFEDRTMATSRHRFPSPVPDLTLAATPRPPARSTADEEPVVAPARGAPRALLAVVACALVAAAAWWVLGRKAPAPVAPASPAPVAPAAQPIAAPAEAPAPPVAAPAEPPPA
ncbi:MAG: serine/threonine protein kinase, partial [Deltaproteobacteria bacterium]|nr:serine/threonine protein kinase [Deltaproteobacteria bacterium]